MKIGSEISNRQKERRTMSELIRVVKAENLDNGYQRVTIELVGKFDRDELVETIESALVLAQA